MCLKNGQGQEFLIGEAVKGQMSWGWAVVMTLDLSLTAVGAYNSQVLLGYAAVTTKSQ